MKFKVDFFDWSNYTHLTMRVRGDGRSYHVNLHTYGDFDITWHDLWQFPLYTRGGPYWQTVKVPTTYFYFIFV
jgi:NADH dehydrogenase [ubiquinone] 1 alpha subcomplex assembly factor 1